jgi:N-acetylneuraminic acid mutarotase
MKRLNGFRIGNSIWAFSGLMSIWILSEISTSLAVEGTWTRKADMPTARSYLSTAVVNGRIYAIGGALRATTGCSAVEEYDPVTNAWTQKANLPVPRCGLSTCEVDGKIYAIGGLTSPLGSFCFSTVYAYDPATDMWTQKANMGVARAVLSTVVVDGKIYAIGGAYAGGSPALKTMEEYDPAVDVWVTKSDMPTARGFLSASVVDGKIYAIGGASTKFGPTFKTVEEYDPGTDTWTQKADMPTARGWFSTSTVNGKIYAIGGADSPNASALSAVDEYDPETDNWTAKMPMPTARRIFSTSEVDGRIYVIGGFVGAWGISATPISIVEEYDLRPPPPDLNGDGIVDISDLVRLIESWGQDDPLCDIAPLSVGDGVVDSLDLELLMSHWERPIDDPTLIAHWTLDEAEGTVAYDSVGVDAALLVGDPVWQPEGGVVGGALALDGIDDYAFAKHGLNPADGSFSVFAWINGGEPGQVILSQSDHVNWLLADSSGGNLITEIKGSGRSAGALLSQTNITDGNWHRIGFVWDGSYRTLYVDDVIVAEDTQEGIESSPNGLYIGTGKALEPGTFFSGLIDDIRIYNRAVSP